MTLVYGDHPQFSDAQLAEIRLLVDREWRVVHRHKNEASSPQVRDALTEKLLRLESILEETGGVE